MKYFNIVDLYKRKFCDSHSILVHFRISLNTFDNQNPVLWELKYEKPLAYFKLKKKNVPYLLK